MLSKKVSKAVNKKKIVSKQPKLSSVGPKSSSSSFSKIQQNSFSSKKQFIPKKTLFAPSKFQPKIQKPTFYNKKIITTSFFSQKRNISSFSFVNNNNYKVQQSPKFVLASNNFALRVDIKPHFFNQPRKFCIDTEVFKKPITDTLSSIKRLEQSLDEFSNSVEYKNFSSLADTINSLNIPSQRALSYIEVLAERGINSKNFGTLDQEIMKWGINNGEDVCKILHAANWYKHYKKIPVHHYQNLPSFSE